MAKRRRIGQRAAAFALSGAVAASGFVFAAAQGGAGAETTPSFAPQRAEAAARPSTTVARQATDPAPAAGSDAATQAPSATLEAGSTAETATPAAVLAPKPSLPPVSTSVAVRASPPPATDPAQSPDLPRYPDTRVLALAAAAMMPTGRTFRECVGALPEKPHWPAAVHLYYAGHGRWVVETHAGEIGVSFDEASAEFRVVSFPPPGGDC